MHETPIIPCLPDTMSAPLGGRGIPNQLTEIFPYANTSEHNSLKTLYIQRHNEKSLAFYSSENIYSGPQIYGIQK